MRWLKQLSKLALYILCILGSKDLFNSRDYLFQLRAQVPWLAEWQIEPSWSILVMTSPIFIWSAPIIPILGVVAAWKQRNNAKLSLRILLGSALMTFVLELFLILNEPTEGQLLCC
jgi:hypothetical protein